MIFIVVLAGFVSGESISVGNREEIGTCMCDITTDSCDPYCCCDSTCSSSLVNSWEGRCLVETVVPKSSYCSKVTSDSLEAGQRGMKVATDLTNKVLCVKIDNSPPSLDFFDVISSASSGRSYNTTSTSLEATLQKPSGSYNPGDLIYGKLTINPNTHIWSLPAPDAYGICSNFSPVKFLISSPETDCSVMINPSDTNQCKRLDLRYFTSYLNLGKTGDNKSTILVTLGKLYKRTSNSPDLLLSNNAQFVASSVACDCLNAVIEVNYTVFATTASQDSIESARADVVISDISSCESVYVPQRFSLKFTTNSTGYYEKSGNPGYIIGKNVLSGYITSDTTIATYESGFQIPGINLDGSCGTTTHNRSPYLTFGTDLVVSCYYEFTYTELSDYCLSQKLAPIMFNDTLISLLGKYGDIDFTYFDDWVLFDVNTTSPPSNTFGEPGLCTLPTTLVYYITYADIGNVLNPQYKIIHAQRQYLDSTYWQFKLPDKNSKQKFLYTVSINFLEYPKDMFSYFPPAPNPLPVMPDDIMYPFKISDALILINTLALYLL